MGWSASLYFLDPSIIYTLDTEKDATLLLSVSSPVRAAETEGLKRRGLSFHANAECLNYSFRRRETASNKVLLHPS